MLFPFVFIHCHLAVPVKVFPIPDTDLRRRGLLLSALNLRISMRVSSSLLKALVMNMSHIDQSVKSQAPSPFSQTLSSYQANV